MADNQTTTFLENVAATVAKPSDLDRLLQPYLVFYMFITAASSVIGIVGNAMTIATFAVTVALHKTRNAFIVNLAVADLLVTGIVMPYSIFGVVAGKEYFDDRPTLCRFLASICAPGCLASMYTICWISCTRFFYICKYATYMRYFTQRNTGLFIMSIWIMCFLIHMPNHVGWGDSRYSTGFQLCTLDMETLSYSFFYGCCMMAAIGATFYFYFKIYQTIRKSSLSKKMITGKLGKKEPKKEEPKEGKEGAVDPQHPKTIFSESHLRDEVKLAKTSFKIFIIFVCTWTPTAVLILMGINGMVPAPVYLYSVLMAHSNSMCNFFIYYVDNEMFKNAFKNVVRKMLGKKTNLVSAINGNTSITGGM